jgi:transcriptional regulator with XRE-family HTH domain
MWQPDPALMATPRKLSDPSPELLALAHRLRQMRRARELSQEALAAIAGLHPKHLSEIERANKDPRATTVIRIADALGVPVAQLYEGVDEAP